MQNNFPVGNLCGFIRNNIYVPMIDNVTEDAL